MRLVMLPGMDGNGILFQPLLAALPESITPQVIAYPPDVPLGYDALLPMLRAQLPAEDFVLLGESFGGPLALRLAAEQPQRLRGVILSASFIRGPYRCVPRWAAHLVFPWPFRFIRPFSRLRAALGGYASPALNTLLQDTLSRVTPAVLAHRVREILRVDVTAALSACPCPLLYLRGASDHVVPAHNLQRMRTLRPDMQCAVLPAPHLLLQVQPELAAQHIARFVTALSKTQAVAA